MSFNLDKCKTTKYNLKYDMDEYNEIFIECIDGDGVYITKEDLLEMLSLIEENE